jgi:hypothetical protein
MGKYQMTVADVVVVAIFTVIVVAYSIQIMWGDEHEEENGEEGQGRKTRRRD